MGEPKRVQTANDDSIRPKKRCAHSFLVIYLLLHTQHRSFSHQDLPSEFKDIFLKTLCELSKTLVALGSIIHTGHVLAVARIDMDREQLKVFAISKMIARAFTERHKCQSPSIVYTKALSSVFYKRKSHKNTYR